MGNLEALGSFHDAELRQVTHKLDSGLLEMGFSKADGQSAILILCGVIAFRVTDMGMQNVVSRLLIHGANVTLADHELRERVRWISQTCEGEQLSDLSAIDALVQNIAAGEHILFMLEPSWGAEVAAIARALA